MAESNPIQTAHCRGCGYLLRGLASTGACPECGRAFDLADPKSWTRRPPRRIWRWVRWPLAVLLLLVLACASGIGWLYWGWRQEQPAIAWVGSSAGADWAWGPVDVRQIGPSWLKEHAGRWGWLLERALSLDVRLDQSPEARELPGRLRWLERVRVSGSGLTEEWMADLAGGNELRELWLHSTAVTDAFLTRLGQQKKLKILIIANATGVTDAGLAAVASFPELQGLYLFNTQVKGPGLQHLRHVPKLNVLALIGPMVGDDAMPEVAKCAELGVLWLGSTGVTSRGVSELAGLKNLEELSLSDTQVDESVVETLATMTGLKSIELENTPRLSEEALGRLRAALPGAVIQTSVVLSP